MTRGSFTLQAVVATYIGPAPTPHLQQGGYWFLPRHMPQRRGEESTYILSPDFLSQTNVTKICELITPGSKREL